MTNEILLIIILSIFNIFSFGLGFVIGKIWSISGVSTNITSKPQSFFKSEENKPKISIDDKKFVVDIKTDGLEKKYDSLGETKKSTENIQSSINKLKNMKR